MVDTQYMLVNNIILYLSLRPKVNWNRVHEILLAKNGLDLKNFNMQKILNNPDFVFSLHGP